MNKFQVLLLFKYASYILSIGTNQHIQT